MCGSLSDCGLLQTREGSVVADCRYKFNSGLFLHAPLNANLHSSSDAMSVIAVSLVYPACCMVQQ